MTPTISDQFHFLELLSRLREYSEVRVHAYVLVDNYYHLLLVQNDKT